MASTKVSFSLPPNRTQTIRIYSVCLACQQAHSTSVNESEGSIAVSVLSSDSADPKYDIFKHAVDELREAESTGTIITWEHVARTWREKVVQVCGEETGCAKVLLAQVCSTHL